MNKKSEYFTKIRLGKWILLAMAGLFFTCDSKPEEEVLTIATAANLQFAMEELTSTFTKEWDVKCEVILGSSGKLTAQIIQGAPYDIFISADMKYPYELSQKELTVNPPKIYAYGNLVLWTMTKDLDPTIDILSSKEVKHIALANPKTAPYGRAAMEVLAHYRIDDSLDAKFVYGESIAQTNQFIISGAAEIGFTSASVIQAPVIKGQGQWISLPDSLHTPIAQGIVIINHTGNQLPDAQKFYSFLFSPKGREILNKFGYKTE